MKHQPLLTFVNEHTVKNAIPLWEHFWDADFPFSSLRKPLCTKMPVA